MIFSGAEPILTDIGTIFDVGYRLYTIFELVWMRGTTFIALGGLNLSCGTQYGRIHMQSNKKMGAKQNAHGSSTAGHSGPVQKICWYKKGMATCPYDFFDLFPRPNPSGFSVRSRIIYYHSLFKYLSRGAIFVSLAAW